MEFLSKESINSKELLKQINIFREMEYKEKEVNNILTEAEKKRGKFVKLGHDTLLKIIKKEFNLKIDLENIFEMLKDRQNILPMFIDGIFISTYKDKYDREQIMFILTIDQAKQVLLRESRIVRSKVIEYLNLLEKRIRQLERKKGITARKEETEAIKMLLEYGNIPKEKHNLYYMTYSKLPFVALGMKRVERDKLPADDLELIKELENIIEKTILKGIVKKLDVKAIYKECKKACIVSLVDIEQKLIS
ncbi:hypothetical protein [Fusobacterium pseudoperiodonticum]|jgi:hypothetical protein|uniref:Uncharacterized protein n=1 Tax=Fusobacterium pseudoperiodonticum TaxID=2663009 RepID=A0AAD0AQJ0_9FUSO|nr:hypothetical protein [Fusobacterium pseudoperiodonticum]ATV35695.1 hypothetical protein CTM64_06355 [Fusobacterium pseudoperiodonticum]ATV61412.1 hypothetical protein CTM74_06015 [Fusobacterium pseudoperiodonticum]